MKKISNIAVIVALAVSLWGLLSNSIASTIATFVILPPAILLICHDLYKKWKR